MDAVIISPFSGYFPTFRGSFNSDIEYSRLTSFNEVPLGIDARFGFSSSVSNSTYGPYLPFFSLIILLVSG